MTQGNLDIDPTRFNVGGVFLHGGTVQTNAVIR